MQKDPMLSAFLAGRPLAVRRVESVARGVVLAGTYGVPVSDRDDLVQQVLLEVWRTATEPGFELGGDFLALVRTIAHRRCIDRLRGARIPLSIDDLRLADTRAHPHAELWRDELGQLGRRILDELDEDSRELLRWRLGRDMSHREIAERRGQSEGAARTAFHRCLVRARRILASLAPELFSGAESPSRR
jgi:RNA polymerase sigma factor (sigma-70 family)